MADDNQKSRPDGPDIADILEELLLSEGRDPLGKIERVMRITSDVLQNGAPTSHQTEAAAGKGFAETFALILSMALDKPDELARHMAEFAKTVLDILTQKVDPAPQPAPGDRRFRDPLWQQSPVLRGLMQIYLSWVGQMQSWIDAQDLGPEDRLRVDFILRQLSAALSPSNLPLHPSALKRAETSRGMSTVAGLKNLARDVQYNRGMPRQVKPGYFEVGRNLATTPGAVVFRNPVLELIQYSPRTAHVHRRPVCLVPPQINKYYAFDLKPANSMLGHLVDQGFRVFTISWKNPDRRAADWGIERYIDAIKDAIRAMQVICDSDQVNLFSACAGGLTTISLLGHLAQTRDTSVRSHSLLVTALFPGNGSTLEAFTTAENLELSRRISRAEGTMDGQDLAHLFVWLRPEELVWKYWVNNNVLGRQPPPLDVLYWDNDSTRVPARLHADFIDMYLKDVFRNPGQQALFGHPIDYDNLEVPMYFVGGEEDYLMPWRGVYKVAKRFRGDHRFILSTSGHVQSILRPPNLANTSYLTNETLQESADQWLAGATRVSGSWWQDWSRWLQTHAGPSGVAPEALGARDYPPLCDAPGTYVHEPMSRN